MTVGSAGKLGATDDPRRPARNTLLERSRRRADPLPSSRTTSLLLP